MKTMFIEARSDADVRLPKTALARLIGRIGVATTVQHAHRIKDVLEQIPGSVFAGQVLGCRADGVRRLAGKVDAFLYVGGGEFHPLRVALEAGGKTVFVFNPFSGKFTTLDKRRVESHQKRVRGALLRFYSAKTVGLLVTTKPGQNNGVLSTFSQENKMALPLRFLARKDKKYYLFAADTIDHRSLEDFPFVECWLNFACNRMMDDENNKIVNIQDVLEAGDGRA